MILPHEHFSGRLLFAIPHMDDCVLGCGGTLALLANHAEIHAVYATDGARSPAPPWPWRDHAPEDLPSIRRAEASAALSYLGVPASNLHFFDLPDSHLRQHQHPLATLMDELVADIQPDTIFAPFRYDRHPDHLVLNRVITERIRQKLYQSALIEYFVYHRWKLLPRGDIRRYIQADQLLTVDTRSVAPQKRNALDCFASQTTLFYDWQTRPNLTPQLLDEVSQSPEMFLRYDEERPETAIFTHARMWIPIAHFLEPVLKKHKDQVVALLKRGLHG